MQSTIKSNSVYLSEWMIEFAKEIAGRLVMSQDPGKSVQGLRNAYNITQKDLSELLELRRETLSRIENGRINPSSGFVCSIAKVFTLIEAGKVQCEKRGGIQIPFFNRMSKDFGVSQEKSDAILKIAMDSYNKGEKP